MPELIKIYINDQEYQCQKGEKLLDVATKNGVEIPHLCYYPDLKIEGSCRICLVEDSETNKVVTSCTLKAKDGLKISTNTEAVKKLRQTNLELLFAEHKNNCQICQKNLPCKTLQLMEKYQISDQSFSSVKRNQDIHKMNCAIEYDPELCIGCNACVKACRKIGVGFVNLHGKGISRTVAHNQNEKIDCIYCGQCSSHCKIAAIREQNQVEFVEAALSDPSKQVIAVLSPAIFFSIGDEFNQKPGSELIKQTHQALEKLGFKKSISDSLGADASILAMAEEFQNRLQKEEDLPMIISSCPSVVKMIESYNPQLMKKMSTTRSGQIANGGAIKTWWANKKNINPADIITVSISTCTSSKYEANNEQLRVNQLKPIDYAITTREFAQLLKKKNINLVDLNQEVDENSESYQNNHSASSMLANVSGGIALSILKACSKNDSDEVGISLNSSSKEQLYLAAKQTVQLNGRDLKIAVATSPKAIRKIIVELKKDPKAYDLVEFMACPGSCMGGGGQATSGTEQSTLQRIEALLEYCKTEKVVFNNQTSKDYINYLKEQSPETQTQLMQRSFSIKKKNE